MTTVAALNDEHVLRIIKKCLKDNHITKDNYTKTKNIKHGTIINIRKKNVFYKFTIFDNKASIDERINEDNKDTPFFKGTRIIETIDDNKYTCFVIQDNKNIDLHAESVNTNKFIEKFGNFLLDILKYCVDNDYTVGFIDMDQLTIDRNEIKLTDPTIFIKDSSLSEPKDDITNRIILFKFNMINKMFNFKQDKYCNYALKSVLLRCILLYYLVIMTRRIDIITRIPASDEMNRFFDTFEDDEDDEFVYNIIIPALNFLSFSPKEIFQLGDNPIVFKDISFNSSLDAAYNVIKKQYYKIYINTKIDIKHQLNHNTCTSTAIIANTMASMFNMNFTSSELNEIGFNNKIIASHDVGIIENSINISEFNELKIPKKLLYKPPLNEIISFPKECINIADIKTMQFDYKKPTYCLCSDIHGSVSKLIIFFMQTQLIRLKDENLDYYTFTINKEENNIKRYVLGDYLTIKDHVQTKLMDLESEVTVPIITTIISLIIAFHSTGKCVFLRGNHELIDEYKNIPFLRKLPLFKTLKLNKRIVILSHTSPYKTLYDKLYPRGNLNRPLDPITHKPLADRLAYNNLDPSTYRNIRDSDKASDAFLNDYRIYFDNLSKEYNYNTLEKMSISPLMNNSGVLRTVLDTHGPYYHEYKNKRIKPFRDYDGNFMPKNLNILSIYGHDDNESFAYFDQHGILQNKTGSFNSDGIFDISEINLSNDIHDQYIQQFGDDYLSSFSKTLTDYINNGNFKTGALCIDTTSDYRSAEYDIDHPYKDPIGSFSTLGILVIQHNIDTTNDYTALFVKSVILSPEAKSNTGINLKIKEFFNIYTSRMNETEKKVYMKNENRYKNIITKYLMDILKDEVDSAATKYENLFKSNIVEFELVDNRVKVDPSYTYDEIHGKKYSKYQENKYIRLVNGTTKKVRNYRDDVKICFKNFNKDLMTFIKERIYGLLLFPSDDEEFALLIYAILMEIRYGYDDYIIDNLFTLIDKAIPYKRVTVNDEDDNVFKRNKENTIPSMRIRGGDKNILVFAFILLIFIILIIVVVVYSLSHNSSFNESFFMHISK